MDKSEKTGCDVMKQNRTRTRDVRNLGTAIRLRISILFAGIFGLVVFGFLMNVNLAPVRTAGGVDSGTGFTSLMNIFTIPGFIISGAVVAFAANELYKIYTFNSKPKKYGKQARRARRQSLYTHTSK